MKLKYIDCIDRAGIAGLGLDVRDNGKTVIFPTDTVYGLGANPLSEKGVDACFSLKQRDETKPMPVLFSEVSTIKKFVEFDFNAEKLARKFWPGGLTMVMRIKKGFALSQKIVRNDTLAVRIPDNACCLDVIRACGGSLIGTSANKSGEAAFVDPYDKELERFASNCDYFVRGECSGKVPSTVILVDPEGKLEILREGAVPVADINRQLGKTRMADFS